MALSDTKIRNLVKKDKLYQVADGGGLSLEVLKSGKKVWRMSYRLDGKKERVTIGEYPFITLVEARAKRHEFKEMITHGRSPMKEKQKNKILKEPDTVALFAELWVQDMVIPNNKKPIAIQRILTKDIMPIIGDKLLKDVSVTDILKITDRIKGRGSESIALNARGILKRLFAYAITRDKAQTNPAAQIDAQYIATAKSRDRSLTSNELGILLRTINKSSISPYNKRALHLLILCMVRKRELIEARWDEVDLDTGIWTIPADRMKKNRAHVIFLPTQALDMFIELKSLAGHSDFVFPSPSSNSKSICHATLNAAVKSLGVDIAPFVLHDFRRTASTHLHEAGFNSDYIEKALAHEQQGIRNVYNKAEYADQRREMLQFWANFIDSLLTDNRVILGNFKKTA
jgi:integrase